MKTLKERLTDAWYILYDFERSPDASITEQMVSRVMREILMRRIDPELVNGRHSDENP